MTKRNLLNYREMTKFIQKEGQLMRVSSVTPGVAYVADAEGGKVFYNNPKFVDPNSEDAGGDGK